MVADHNAERLGESIIEVEGAGGGVRSSDHGRTGSGAARLHRGRSIFYFIFMISP